MINCRRPSNKSSRLTLPFGPSNSYFFATAIHGIRRRSAASASREWVKAFSFTSSCWRAASHSCADTIGGVFFGRCPFGFSMSLFVPVAILFLLCFLKQTATTRPKNFSNLADAQGQNSSGGARSSGYDCGACDTCWTHISLLCTSKQAHGRRLSGTRGIRPRLSGPEVLRLAAASAREFQGEVKGFRGF